MTSTDVEYHCKQRITIKREDITIRNCANAIADKVFLERYWMQRTRRSRRISYEVLLANEVVAWLQCADPFGTKLAKPLQLFDINDAVELCRGYFIESAPCNIESCAISKVLRMVTNDWFNEYKVIKKIAIIYQDMDVGQKGIVYKALGFSPYVECTRARSYKNATRGNSSGRKIIWARALRPVSGYHYVVEMPKITNANDAN